MTATAIDPALGALARRHGVQTAYRSADGQMRAVAPDVVAAVLGALGLPLRDPAGATDAWRADQAARATQLLPPVTAHRLGTGAPVEVPLTLPGAASAALARHGATAGRLWLRTEDGQQWSVPLADVVGPALGSQPVDGGAVTHHTLSLRRLAAELPPGYHRLQIEVSGRRHGTTVIVAPRRCPAPPRTWGLLAPVHALRGPTDEGAGTFGDLGALAQWAAGHGAGLTGTLPVYAAFLDGPETDPSPYRPASRLALNDVLVDLHALPDVAAVPAAARALQDAGRAAAVAGLAAAARTDLPALARLRRQVLAPLALAVLAGDAGDARRAAFDRWAARHPEAVAYARFRATGIVGLAAATGTAPACATAALDPRRPQDVTFATHCYGQWMADDQLGSVARSSPLYLDLPIGVHPAGFDPAWAPHAYVQRASVGAPPDLFFASGQDWGLPPLHPEGVRLDGYGHVAAVLRRAMSLAAVVRLDHVMGLLRLWFVPQGLAATDGAYVHYHHDELRAVAVLEAHRSGTAVVGEDLGTVPPEVTRAMESDGMLHSAVWQFSATVADPWPEPPEASLASLATHDLPTFARFLTAGDEPGQPGRAAGGLSDGDQAAERRALRRAVGPDVAEALWRCLAHLAAGPARLLLVDLSDLWLERTQQNVPGTSAAEGSFRLRAQRTLGELAGDPWVAALLQAVDQSRRTGLPQPAPTSVPRGAGSPDEEEP